MYRRMYVILYSTVSRATKLEERDCPLLVKGHTVSLYFLI